MLDVENRRDDCWKKIVDEKKVIPAHSIKLYDDYGNKTGRLLYGVNSVTLADLSAPSHPQQRQHKYVKLMHVQKVKIVLTYLLSTQKLKQ